MTPCQTSAAAMDSGQNSKVAQRPTISTWKNVLSYLKKSLTTLAIVLSLSATAINSAFSLDSDGSEPPATVMFGDVLYRIPKAYLPGVTPFKAGSAETQVGSGYAAFTIGILLPDFRPAATDLDEFRRVGWHKQLNVLVEYGRHFREPSELIEQLLGWAKLNKDDYQQLDNGCRLYRGNMTVTKELYICFPQSRMTMIECIGEHEVPFPSCTVLENLSTDTTVIYNYSRAFIDEGAEIDNKLRALLISFEDDRIIK